MLPGLGAGGRVVAGGEGHGELLLVVDPQDEAIAFGGDGAREVVGLGGVEDVAALEVGDGVDGGLGAGGAGEVVGLGLAVLAFLLVVGLDLVGGVGLGRPLGGVDGVSGHGLRDRRRPTGKLVAGAGGRALEGRGEVALALTRVHLVFEDCLVCNAVGVGHGVLGVEVKF